MGLETEKACKMEANKVIYFGRYNGFRNLSGLRFSSSNGFCVFASDALNWLKI